MIDEKVIVINRDGYIIAGSDSNRIGNFHQGGKEVITTERKLIITESELTRLQGVKIGLNLPMFSIACHWCYWDNRFEARNYALRGINLADDKTHFRGSLCCRKI